MQRSRLFTIAGCTFGTMCTSYMCNPAVAHVKWFNSDYCVTCHPDTLDHIVNTRWMWLLAFSVLVSLCAFIIDRLWTDHANHWVDRFLDGVCVPAPDYLRVGLGIFLLCLWTQPGILLTPELQTSNPVVPWFQLALAATTLSWRTTWVASCGVFVLYGMALRQFGLFHLLDY